MNRPKKRIQPRIHVKPGPVTVRFTKRNRGLDLRSVHRDVRAAARLLAGQGNRTVAVIGREEVLIENYPGQRLALYGQR